MRKLYGEPKSVNRSRERNSGDPNGHVTSLTNQQPGFRETGFSINQRRAETVWKHKRNPLTERRDLNRLRDLMLDASHWPL